MNGVTSLLRLLSNPIHLWNTDTVIKPYLFDVAQQLRPHQIEWTVDIDHQEILRRKLKRLTKGAGFSGGICSSHINVFATLILFVRNVSMCTDELCPQVAVRIHLIIQIEMKKCVIAHLHTNQHHTG